MLKKFDTYLSFKSKKKLKDVCVLEKNRGKSQK